MTRSEKQESATNVALLRRALEIYKKANPKITKVVVRSDNAATYHGYVSMLLICMLVVCLLVGKVLLLQIYLYDPMFESMLCVYVYLLVC